VNGPLKEENLKGFIKERYKLINIKSIGANLGISFIKLIENPGKETNFQHVTKLLKKS
jgi:hypothetical protein